MYEIRMKEKSIEEYAQMSQEADDLLSKVYEFGDRYFADMVFAHGSPTYEYCLGEFTDGSKMDITLPDELEYFSYSWFDFEIITDYASDGSYNPKTQTLTIDADLKDDENTILHEMIHLHEHVLLSLPSFFRDIVFLNLYWDLAKTIPDLDTMIRDHANLWNEISILGRGGTHDILFLLKSFDLDLKRNQPLGTVFAYGYVEEA